MVKEIIMVIQWRKGRNKIWNADLIAFVNHGDGTIEVAPVIETTGAELDLVSALFSRCLNQFAPERLQVLSEQQVEEFGIETKNGERRFPRNSFLSTYYKIIQAIGGEITVLYDKNHLQVYLLEFNKEDKQ